MEKKYYTQDEMHRYWVSGEVFIHNGKKYKVHKMSYGDYFLEPFNSITSETSGFACDTHWFRSKINKLAFGCNEKVYYIEN